MGTVNEFKLRHICSNWSLHKLGTSLLCSLPCCMFIFLITIGLSNYMSILAIISFILSPLISGMRQVHKEVNYVKSSCSGYEVLELREGCID